MSTKLFQASFTLAGSEITNISTASFIFSNCAFSNPPTLFSCAFISSVFSVVVVTEENASVIWPVGNDGSYKNKYKIYGTVQFDAVYTGNFNLNKIKDYISEVINNFL